jgi:hypothetical protein
MYFSEATTNLMAHLNGFKTLHDKQFTLEEPNFKLILQKSVNAKTKNRNTIQRKPKK